jgi:acyl-CoA thioester hydrolase
MSRPDPARLLRESYGFASEVETRFQDLDPLGHINNVAMAAIFEQGRVRFNHSYLDDPRRLRAEGVRWLIARVDINYVAEGHFPAPVTVASAIGRVGTSSWTILSAAFQESRAIATCDCTIVQTTRDGALALSEDFRGRLVARMFGKVD